MKTDCFESLQMQRKSWPKFNRVWVAYSGGCDSHVLLHAVAKLRKEEPDLSLNAVHVHHGLNSQADTWVDHCQRVCNELNIALTVRKVSVDRNHPAGLEAAAREARYTVFSELVQPNDLLLLAHHQRDQAETVLLRLLRGAGLSGLMAMRAQQTFGIGQLIRPFLYFPYADLKAYAEKENLSWIEDSSNQETRFDRNYLRQEIWPLLKARWSGLDGTLSRASVLCQETQSALDEYIANDFPQFLGEREGTLSVTALLSVSKAKRNTLLRYWLQKKNLLMPSARQLDCLDETVLRCASDAMPILPQGKGGYSFRRYRDDLHAVPALPDFDGSQVITWDMKTPLVLSSMRIELNRTVCPADFLLFIENTAAQLHFRQSGKKFRIWGREGSRPTKKIFQEWGVPPWQRTTWPLVLVGNHLIPNDWLVISVG